MDNEKQENELSHKEGQKKPSVYEYISFRRFLKESYEHLASKNSSFSESAFMRKVGYSTSSRGYFSLILKGKRNLSHSSVLKFSKTLKLSKRETDYFESLVFFNQAQNEEDKSYYMDKMSQFIKGKETEGYELLKSQHNYLSKWYLVAIREIVVLDDFVNDEEWIAKRLRNKVSKREVREAINDLLRLKLLKFDEARNLCQLDPVVNFLDNELNHTVVSGIHKQYLNRTEELLSEDSYNHRSASSVTISCYGEDFLKIREEIIKFREHIINKYGTRDQSMDTVLHMGIQLIHLTEPDCVNGSGVDESHKEKIG